jgi:DNA N-6-adenine-methyltransferase (Dam)
MRALGRNVRWSEMTDGEFRNDSPLGFSNAKDVTKTRRARVTKPPGRPLIGKKPMTAAERMRRYRNRKKIIRPHRGRSDVDDVEWFTPSEVIEVVRDVMGSIDTDPASCAIANETVRATQFFTIETNGLKQPWRGAVFMNPPYRQPDNTLFVDKLIAELASGRVSQAIVLTNNSTDSGWYSKLRASAAAQCFTRRRINFIKIDGKHTHPTQGQLFTYFGKNVDRFVEMFASIGHCHRIDGAA